jgi:putative SOS response-associated peptidase YedK
MCGRYTLYKVERLRDRYGLDSDELSEALENLGERYNVSPSQIMPTIRRDESGDNHVEPMRWGYMPFWAKDFNEVFKYKTFNARSETMFDRRMWKEAALSRRCLVPATGFYEWKKTPSGKQPFFIHPKDQELFSFAGVWGSWKDAEGNKWHTYSIVTTEPNEEVSDIHNRMPVILSPDEEDLWADPTNTAEQDIAPLMHPYPDNMLELYEVSRDVNTSRVDEETLVMPINAK